MKTKTDGHTDNRYQESLSFSSGELKCFVLNLVKIGLVVLIDKILKGQCNFTLLLSPYHEEEVFLLFFKNKLKVPVV